MIPRIYIDTSIVGGFFDKEFEVETKLLFERLEKGEVIFVASELIASELTLAPKRVQDLFQGYVDKMELVQNSTEAKELAQQYVDEKVVGATSFDDCNHIAIATLQKVEVLASWNFKHIVNLQRIQGYNAVNLKNGYATLEIRNPKELIRYENCERRKWF